MNHDCPACLRSLRWFKLVSNEEGVCLCPRCHAPLRALRTTSTVWLVVIGMLSALCVALGAVYLALHPLILVSLGILPSLVYVCYQNLFVQQGPMWALAEPKEQSNRSS